jgi:hypothetical protein
LVVKRSERSLAISLLAAAPACFAVSGCGSQEEIPLADVPRITDPAPRLPHPGAVNKVGRDSSAPKYLSPPRSETADK